jgi:hypothetical protein
MPEIASCEILGERNVELMKVHVSHGIFSCLPLQKELSKFDLLRYQDVIFMRKT